MLWWWCCCLLIPCLLPGIVVVVAPKCHGDPFQKHVRTCDEVYLEMKYLIPSIICILTCACMPRDVRRGYWLMLTPFFVITLCWPGPVEGSWASGVPVRPVPAAVVLLQQRWRFHEPGMRSTASAVLPGCTGSTAVSRFEASSAVTCRAVMVAWREECSVHPVGAIIALSWCCWFSVCLMICVVCPVGVCSCLSLVCRRCSS